MATHFIKPSGVTEFHVGPFSFHISIGEHIDYGKVEAPYAPTYEKVYLHGECEPVEIAKHMWDAAEGTLHVWSHAIADTGFTDEEE